MAYTNLKSGLSLADVLTSVRTGVTDGSGAGTGQIGEILSANRAVGNSVALSNSYTTDIISLSLSTGSWEVVGDLIISAGGLLVGCVGSLVTVSETGSTEVGNALFNTPSVSNVASAVFSPQRFEVDENGLVVYLTASYSPDDPATVAYGAGSIRALRIR